MGKKNNAPTIHCFPEFDTDETCWAADSPLCSRLSFSGGWVGCFHVTGLDVQAFYVSVEFYNLEVLTEYWGEDL